MNWTTCSLKHFIFILGSVWISLVPPPFPWTFDDGVPDPQFKLAEQLVEQASKAGLEVAESDLRIVAAGKLPRSVSPVEVTADPPSAEVAMHSSSTGR